MTAREVVETCKKTKTFKEVGDDILYEAIKRLEIMISKFTLCELPEFNKEKPLLASGGAVSSGYGDLYEIYAKREVSFALEDWDCFERYDVLYNSRYAQLREEIVRNGSFGDKKIKQEWNWKAWGA
jgi:hypothetical protein